MLEIKNIKKSFGGVEAIKGSNFSVPKGKITALIGPNGAGKTTLFNIITGLIKPDSGNILFNEKNIIKEKSHNVANLGISRTFQQVRLFSYLSISDHLDMVQNNEDIKWWKQIFIKNKKKNYSNLLKEYGIDRNQDTLVKDLSFGQRKLLNIAMAVEKEHSLLLLDEPVAGVNSIVQKRIENLLQKFKEKGETMLIIDHDMEFIRNLADVVVCLDAGVVIAKGNPDEVLNNKKVLEAYLGE